VLLYPNPRQCSADPSQAALSGVIASRTLKVVISMPIISKLGGLDALLSTIQIPKIIPVASVRIDNGVNSALLAVRILDLEK